MRTSGSESVSNGEGVDNREVDEDEGPWDDDGVVEGPAVGMGGGGGKKNEKVPRLLVVVGNGGAAGNGKGGGAGKGKGGGAGKGKDGGSGKEPPDVIYNDRSERSGIGGGAGKPAVRLSGAWTGGLGGIVDGSGDG